MLVFGSWIGAWPMVQRISDPQGAGVRPDDL